MGAEVGLMYEEILPGLYRIEIPLPRNPLKSLNSYLVKAPGRSLLIDTGMNREECLQAMSASLDELRVDLNRTDLFVTHLHADHLGLAARLATAASKVYISRKDAAIIADESSRGEWYWEDYYQIYCANGFPEDEARQSLDGHPGRRYGLLGWQPDFCIVVEGDTLDCGGYRFRCLATPGHTPGHMCLYEADKKILVSGDHILFDITPNITSWPEVSDSLGDYLASLDKVYDLEVGLVLPSHRRLMPGHRQRIEELKEHHRDRANEMLSALAGGARTAFQVAAYITWDIDCSSFELFPPVQKWFATGETIAHLRYLEVAKKVRSEIRGGRILFSLA
ncbi:MAG: MBL fold metallo-hydrolase [Chloroflexota bacterium]